MMYGVCCVPGVLTVVGDGLDVEDGLVSQSKREGKGVSLRFDLFY